MTRNYQITFFSDWHCGSGQSRGFGVDLTVIRDRHKLPYVPGKTVKGLLRDAAENLSNIAEEQEEWRNFIDTVFGVEDRGHDDQIEIYFSDAVLPGDIRKYLLENEEEKRFLFREISSTAINERGVAQKHSLRALETTVPVTLQAYISSFPDTVGNKRKLRQCMQWIKRLGLNRNRGLGRCLWQEVELNEGETV